MFETSVIHISAKIFKYLCKLTLVNVWGKLILIGL